MVELERAVWCKKHPLPVKGRIMTEETKVTGRLVAAARALAGISLEDFSQAAGLPVRTMSLIEANGSAWLNSDDDAAAVLRACGQFGIVLLDERDGMGAGVRLKFTRQDVKQILRLEGEGGVTSSDGNP